MLRRYQVIHLHMLGTRATKNRNCKQAKQKPGIFFVVSGSMCASQRASERASKQASKQAHSSRPVLICHLSKQPSCGNQAYYSSCRLVWPDASTQQANRDCSVVEANKQAPQAGIALPSCLLCRLVWPTTRELTL